MGVHRRGDPLQFAAGLELAGGIRSPYPPGLVVGSVVDVERDANDVVQTAFLAPAAELDSFDLALVITDYEGGLPPVGSEEHPRTIRALDRVLAIQRPVVLAHLRSIRLRHPNASASDIVRIPYEQAYEQGFEDMPRRVPDISKIRALVGYEPTVGLDEILSHVIEYFRQQ